MSDPVIDRLARSIARRHSRRQFLAATMSAAAVAVIRSHPAAAQQCADDSACQSPFTCQDGFCQAPGCTAAGLGCAAHTDCCEGLICQSGQCAVSVRCSFETEPCGNGCCPGLVCAAGSCVVETPAPPEGSGGGSGSGGNGGSSGSSGGSSGGGGGSGSGGGSGTTSGGVTVAALPTTGAAEPLRQQGNASWATLAAAVGIGALAGRLRHWRHQAPSKPFD